MNKWIGSNFYYFAGMAAGYGVWRDHSHVWAWLLAAFVMCFFGAAVLDRR